MRKRVEGWDGRGVEGEDREDVVEEEMWKFVVKRCDEGRGRRWKE